MATLRTERLSDADVAAWGERLADGIARGMQLDPRMLDVVICTLLAGGHPLLDGRAVRPRPGHRRPAADRRAGDDDLARQHRDLRVPRRADLRQRRPRRRA